METKILHIFSFLFFGSLKPQTHTFSDGKKKCMYNYFWVIELIKVQEVNRLYEFSQGKMPREGRIPEWKSVGSSLVEGLREYFPVKKNSMGIP